MVRPLISMKLHPTFCGALALGCWLSTAAAEVIVLSTNYAIVAPEPAVALQRQRELEWSARIFETLLGIRPPSGRVTLSDAPANSLINSAGSVASLVNTFPLTPQPPAADGTVWNLGWYAREPRTPLLGGPGLSALTHEAAHLQLTYAVNFHSAATLQARYNGYGSFLPDWLDEAVAVFHEPDALKAARRSRFKLSTHVPLKRFFVMPHPGETGRAQVVRIEASTPEEVQQKIAAFTATQRDTLTATADKLVKDSVSVDAFYSEALAVIEYLTARGGLPFFRHVVVQQNYDKSMEEILRTWPAKLSEIEAQRSAVERAAAAKPPLRGPVEGDPAGPRPPRANTIAGVLVRPGEALHAMPGNLDALDADFAGWVRKNYPRYRAPLAPYPAN